jgi:hypothetical protein
MSMPATNTLVFQQRRGKKVFLDLCLEVAVGAEGRVVEGRTLLRLAAGQAPVDVDRAPVTVKHRQ